MSEERPLVGPYEIFELADGQSFDLEPTSWERGTIVIHPRYPGAPAEKVISVLRLHLRTGSKPYPPMYYDVTAKTLIAQLMPLLSYPDFVEYRYRVTKHGVAPRARFTLERLPV